MYLVTLVTFSLHSLRMTIAKKIVLLIFGVITVFIGCNIFFLQFFTGQYFYDYLEDLRTEIKAVNKAEETKARISDIESEIFEIIAQYPEQAPALLEKYQIINQDLTTLSNALEAYIDSEPEINSENVSNYLVRQWVRPADVDEIIDTSSIATFLQNAPLTLSFGAEKTPERIFVTKVLSSVLLVNLALLAVLTIGVYIYVRRLFRPIDRITRNINRIIHSSRYDKIRYERSDEFQVLIESINDLNEKLSHQESIRSQFLTDMSHELKTPMAAIRVYLEGIQDGVIKLNEKNTQALIDEIKRLTRIVESMMTFQTFEEKAISFRFEKIKLKELSVWMQEYYQGELSATKQTIKFIWNARETVVFDRDYLMQVFHNAISNFIRYAGEWSTLCIEHHTEWEGEVLSFKDDGVGVDADELPYLKEKFYQVDKAKSGDIEKRGIGVGLSIVDKVVRELGGHMDLMSKKGEGFHIVLHFPQQVIVKGKS